MKVNLIFLFSLLTIQIWAQNTQIDKCGTAILEDEMRSNSAEADENFRLLDENYAIAAQQKNQQTDATVLTIPVVFHVIYNDEGDNITKDQILDALQVLNDDFRRLNKDAVNTRPIFVNVADDMEIEFQLARLDPQGNCTEGILRKQSSLSVNARDNVKPLSNWDNKKYLNIWIVNSISVPGSPSGTVLGYAYRPSPGQHYTKDGVVIRHDMMGRIGTATGIGRTLTHEVGHYLGLKHPFDNGCNAGDNCTDTPPVASASFGCDLTRNSCSNDNPDLVDQIENYMDYADDVCTNMFTTQQKNIMRTSLGNNNLRGYLVSGNNPTNTGIADGQILPCKAEANFTPSEMLICEGESIQFNDASTHGNPVSYLWTFNGGQPATSTLANPTVQYNTKGAYDVTLSVTNNNGTTVKTEKHRISVRALNPSWVNSFGDDFEQWNIPNNNWHVAAEVDTINFFTAQNTGFNSSKSVKLNNYNINSIRTVDLITNSVDLSNTKSINLSFDLAYAKKISSISSDIVKIYYSTDCGETWIFKRIIGGTQLWTASPTDAAFTPSSSSEWKSVNVSITGLSYEPSVMFKFEFNASGGGNNFYIDNVNFLTTIGIDEEEIGFSKLNLFPNPAHSILNIALDVKESDNYNVTLYDLSGRKVQSLIEDEKLSNGSHVLERNLNESLKTGIYLVEIQNSQGSKFEKLIIE